MFTLMVAMDRHGAIGKNNTLPWNLPDDLRHFKEYTKGKAVLMGHTTALSIGRALPGRTNIVLSRAHTPPYEGQIHLRSIAEVLHHHMHTRFPEIVVCGGSQVYDTLLPYVQKLVITRVDTVVADADTFFTPLEELEATQRWNIVAKQYHKADERHAYDFSIRTYHHSDYAPTYNASPKP